MYHVVLQSYITVNEAWHDATTPFSVATRCFACIGQFESLFLMFCLSVYLTLVPLRRVWRCQRSQPVCLGSWFCVIGFFWFVAKAQFKSRLGRKSRVGCQSRVVLAQFKSRLGRKSRVVAITNYKSGLGHKSRLGSKN